MKLVYQIQDRPKAKIALNPYGDFDARFPDGKGKVFSSIRNAARSAIKLGYGFEVEAEELDPKDRVWVERYIANECE